MALKPVGIEDDGSFVGRALTWLDTRFARRTESINIFPDVDTATVAPSVGDVLEWNGTAWVPAEPAAGGGGGAGIPPVPVGPAGTTIGPFGLVQVSATQNNFSTNFGFMVPFIVPEAITVDRIFCRVDTADAGATVGMGLWASDAGGRPSTYLGGGTATPSATGNLAVTVDIDLPPGIYWGAAAASSNATLRLRCGNVLTGALFSAYVSDITDTVFSTAPRWSAVCGTYNTPGNVTGFGYGLPDRMPLVALRRSA
jgi:hypothetical protein